MYLNLIRETHFLRRIPQQTTQPDFFFPGVFITALVVDFSYVPFLQSQVKRIFPLFVIFRFPLFGPEFVLPHHAQVCFLLDVCD